MNDRTAELEAYGVSRLLARYGDEKMPDLGAGVGGATGAVER